MTHINPTCPNLSVENLDVDSFAWRRSKKKLSVYHSWSTYLFWKIGASEDPKKERTSVFYEGQWVFADPMEKNEFCSSTAMSEASRAGVHFPWRSSRPITLVCGNGQSMQREPRPLAAPQRPGGPSFWDLVQQGTRIRKRWTWSLKYISPKTAMWSLTWHAPSWA